MESKLQVLKERLQKQLQEKLERNQEVDDGEIYERIDELIMELSREEYLGLTLRRELRRELFNAVRKLDILQELLDDNTITEIMVNGTEAIFLERAGQLRKWDKRFIGPEKLEDMVQQIVAKCNRVVNEAEPIVDARLENGARVNVVLKPAALNGPIITIRRFPDKPIQMEQLTEWGTITEEAVAFLRDLVKAGYNIFISGGTGSGKTTFLNVLSDFIPKDERVITIEDNAELQIQGVENLVRLESRRGAWGGNNITIRDLIKASLRMRPDRIIVGEVRGNEAIDMLQALNTGHDGSLSTGHGNSPKDMLSRLETMVLMGMDLPVTAIRRQIASGLDIMVHLGRLRDKSRKVLEILEITDYIMQTGEIGTRQLYEFVEEGEMGDGRVKGRLQRREPLLHVRKLQQAGIRSVAVYAAAESQMAEL